MESTTKEKSIDQLKEEQKTKFKSPEEICDGKNLSEDLLILAGYCVSLGWTEFVMPSEHLASVHSYLLWKYGNQKPLKRDRKGCLIKESK